MKPQFFPGQPLQFGDNGGTFARRQLDLFTGRDIAAQQTPFGVGCTAVAELIEGQAAGMASRKQGPGPGPGMNIGSNDPVRPVLENLQGIIAEDDPGHRPRLADDIPVQPDIIDPRDRMWEFPLPQIFQGDQIASQGIGKIGIDDLISHLIVGEGKLQNNLAPGHSQGKAP